MSEEKKTLTRKEKQARAAQKTQELADQIWAFLKTQVPACSKDGVVNMKDLAYCGDSFINALARKQPREKSLVVAAAIRVRSELEARFRNWAADLQKPADPPVDAGVIVEAIKSCEAAPAEPPKKEETPGA